MVGNEGRKSLLSWVERFLDLFLMMNGWLVCSKKNGNQCKLQKTELITLWLSSSSPSSEAPEWAKVAKTGIWWKVGHISHGQWQVEGQCHPLEESHHHLMVLWLEMVKGNGDSTTVSVYSVVWRGQWIGGYLEQGSMPARCKLAGPLQQKVE